MLRSLLSALFLLTFVSLLVYTVLLNPDTQSSLASQDPIVVNAITGCELKAQIANNEVTITLKNNHLETVTAFALGLGDTYRITEDFAYSEVHSGIAPGDTFEKRYHLPGSLTGSVPTLYLSSVLLDGGREEGDPLVAQKIRDERLGEKLQVFRTVRILERQRDLPKDLKILKHDVAAALNAAESETLTALNELRTSSRRSDNKLSDDVRKGLQVGREKMLQRLEALEQLPSEIREEGFTELKTRSRHLLTKL